MSNVYEERLTESEREEYADLKTKILAEDHRICFGVVWFKHEEEAQRYGELNEKLGFTVNGGWYHGAPLSRPMAEGFDKRDKEGNVIEYACLD